MLETRPANAGLDRIPFQKYDMVAHIFPFKRRWTKRSSEKPQKP
jgi:hypothetical protein